MLKLTKTILNTLAKTLYEEEAYCEYQASGKRGWILYHHQETVWIGANITVAFAYLQAIEPKASEKQPVEVQTNEIPAFKMPQLDLMA